MEKMETQKTPNTLKSEHLKEGVLPIIASIGTHEDFDEFIGSDFFTEDREWDDVDYLASPDDLVRKNFKNNGRKSYVISPLDDLNKFSTQFRNCTGVVVSGKDKQTGKYLSFLSHEDPQFFTDPKNLEIFTDDLKKLLREVKEKCEEGTIDAVVVGGNHFTSLFDENDDSDARKEQEKQDAFFRKKYQESIEILSREIFEMFRFEPVIIVGPKMTHGEDYVYYDNEQRRLYIFRPRTGDSSSESYLPGDYSQQEEKWRKEEIGGDLAH